MYILGMNATRSVKHSGCCSVCLCVLCVCVRVSVCVCVYVCVCVCIGHECYSAL